MRTLVGDDAIVGLSTHTAEQFDAGAARAGDLRRRSGRCSAPRPRRPATTAVGLERVRELARQRRNRAACRWSRSAASRWRTQSRVLDAGAAAVAVISDLVAAGDPEARLRAYHRTALAFRVAPRIIAGSLRLPSSNTERVHSGWSIDLGRNPSIASWPTSRRAASDPRSGRSVRSRWSRSASAPSSAPASSCAPPRRSPSGPGPSVTLGVPRRRPRLRVRRPLLRRVRLDDPDRRQRLHLLLRDDGRARRVDHRLGPDASSTRSAPPRSRSPGASTSTRCSSTSACTCPTHGVTRRSRSTRGPASHGIMNVPALVHPRCPVAAAHPRHAGVGVRQQPHRHHQGRRSS